MADLKAGALVFNGMPVVVTDAATAKLPEAKWDWSRYRSPSRAKRRRHRAWVIKREPACWVTGGGTILIHPVLWDALREEVANG